jgi:hypothetical protein
MCTLPAEFAGKKIFKSDKIMDGFKKCPYLLCPY